ncbi:MAG: hypothetical protein QOI78_894 [Actinomycetota bacterium]|jgi:hypothetical protein|nr:hypothetical protein [Actinomycetota bacterium]
MTPSVALQDAGTFSVAYGRHRPAAVVSVTAERGERRRSFEALPGGAEDRPDRGPHPEVAFCAATTGPATLFISLTCRDDRDLYRYLVERLGASPHLGEVQTAPVIRVVKRAAAGLERTAYSAAQLDRTVDVGGVGRGLFPGREVTSAGCCTYARTFRNASA